MLTERKECDKVKLDIDKLIPKYARLPLIVAVMFNFATYIGANLIVGDAPHTDISMKIDSFIPFCPFFITFYILSYVQWVVGYIVISHHSREYCYKVVTADLIAKTVCFLFYVFFPTTLVRPEITGNGFFEFVTRIVYAVDPASNLFPSIHCLESWVVFRCALKMKLPNWYKVLMGFFSLGVFASVVFVKQHVFIDIPAGVLVFELGYLITHLSGLHVAIMKRIPCKTDQNEIERQS